MSQLILAALIILNSFGAASAYAEEDKVPSSLVHIGRGPFYPAYAFVVDKKARTLSVWSQENGRIQRVVEYASDMGRKSGDKSAQGDFRTPEGIYFLQTQLEGRKQVPFELYGLRAFTTDYPNLFDRRAGKTGNGIWLHAIPETETLERGSRGCVVVRNESILALTKYVTLGRTPLLIQDEVNLVDPTTVDSNSREIQAQIEGWRNAWANKNIEAYMKFYSEDFKSLGMKKASWQKFKMGLATKYNNIKITLSTPSIFQFRDEMIVRMLQEYKSSGKEDFGEKILYFKKENGRYRIVAEAWAEEAQPEAFNELASQPLSASLVKPASEKIESPVKN